MFAEPGGQIPVPVYAVFVENDHQRSDLAR